MGPGVQEIQRVRGYRQVRVWPGVSLRGFSRCLQDLAHRLCDADQLVVQGFKRCVRVTPPRGAYKEQDHIVDTVANSHQSSNFSVNPNAMDTDFAAAAADVFDAMQENDCHRRWSSIAAHMREDVMDASENRAAECCSTDWQTSTLSLHGLQ